MTRCKYCHQIVFWSLIGGAYKPFDDTAKSLLHVCAAIQKQKSLAERLEDLEDVVRALCNRIEIHSNLIEELQNNHD